MNGMLPSISLPIGVSGERHMPCHPLNGEGNSLLPLDLGRLAICYLVDLIAGNDHEISPWHQPRTDNSDHSISNRPSKLRTDPSTEYESRPSTDHPVRRIRRLILASTTMLLKPVHKSEHTRLRRPRQISIINILQSKASSLSRSPFEICTHHVSNLSHQSRHPNTKTHCQRSPTPKHQ